MTGGECTSNETTRERGGGKVVALRTTRVKAPEQPNSAAAPDEENDEAHNLGLALVEL